MSEIKVYISGMPNKYYTFKLKLFLNNLLGDYNAVVNIKRSSVKNVAEVSLKKVKQKLALMDKSPLSWKLGTNDHQLLVTSNNPSGAETENRNPTSTAKLQDMEDADSEQVPDIEIIQSEDNLATPGDAEDNQRHCNVPQTQGQELQAPTSHFSHVSPEPKTKNNFPDQSEEVSSTEARTWEDILATEAELCNHSIGCVLVQNLPETASDQSIQLFFENKQHSGGDEVYMLCKIRDGVLVAFVDAQVARKVSERDDLCFGRNRLKTFFKPFPAQFDDRFVVSGVSPKTSMETIEMYIEDCFPNKTVPVDVKKISAGKFMVIYNNEEDIRAIMKCIEQKKLEDCVLKTKVVCRSDCVKVTNIAKYVKDDTIKLFFQTKSRTDGGPVTLLERSDEHILVYFADYQVAERVVAKCEADPPQLTGKTINVALHYPGLEENQTLSTRKLHTRKSSNLSTTEPATQDKSINSYKIIGETKQLKKLELIRTSSKILALFKKEYDDLAHVKIFQLTDANSIAVIVIKLLQKPNEKYTEKLKFQSECSRRYSKFLLTMETKLLEEICSSNLLNDGKYHVITVAEQVDVLVRWKSGCVDITGLKDDLAIAEEFFKSRSEAVEVSVSLLELKFRAFVDCKIITDLQEKYLQRVKISEKHNCIHLKGNALDVAEVKNEIVMLNLDLESTKLSGLDDRTVEFIAQSLNECDSGKIQKSSVNLRDIIQKEFSQRKVKAFIHVNSNNEIIVMFLEKEHFTNAKAELLKLVNIVKIPCEDIEYIVQLYMWEQLVKKITSTKSMRVIVNKQGGEIVIVGLTNSLPFACGNIGDFIQENTLRVELVKMEYMHAKFVMDYFKDYMMKSHGAVKWQLRNAGGIEIEGKDSKVKQAVAWLTEISKTIKTEKHVISDVGVSAYFRDTGKSKKLLTRIEKKIKCVIMVDSCTLPAWDQKQQDVGTGSKPMLDLKSPDKALQLQGSNFEVMVVKGDITMADCDAIVNTLNEELVLRNVGISGSIWKKGGQSIQEELTKYKSQHGRLLPGMAMTTGAGNLKFKRIIHTVGPTWGASLNCEQDLKSCISETLNQAESYNLTSLAIPAISCGVFGGDPVLCTRLIVEAIVEHFKIVTSSIKQVFLVENSNTNVLNSFVNTVDTLQSSSKVAKGHFVVQPTKAKKSLFTPSEKTNKLMVNLVQGDLATQKVDVIVTTANPQDFAKGIGSAVTKSLMQHTGPQLQTIMQQLGQHGNLQLGDVQESPGYQLNCQEIYHIMISYYSTSTHSLSKQHLMDGVTTCLQKADNARYTSIAFPTLGTGGFKYPGTSVARWMHHAIDAFTPRNLKTVTIVLYPGNTLNWMFQNEFGSPQLIQSSKVGGVTVNVKQGDITAENSEAIVIPTDVNYKLTGQVAQALLAKCGPGLQTNILNPVARGNNVIMASGSPLFKYIFCIVSGNDQNELIKILVAIFTHADSVGVRTLSIPAIGGNVGINNVDIARNFGSAINTYSIRSPGNLQQINIVVFQSNMLPDFQHEFPSSNLVQMATVSSSARVYSDKSSNKNDALSDQVTLFICSNQQHIIDKAWESITSHIRSMTSKKTIDDVIISEITSLEEQEIMDLQRKFQVKIEKTQNKLVFSGVKDKVQDAYEQAWNILHEFQKALICAESVVWSYGDTGKPIKFEVHENLKLEEAYKKTAKPKTSVPIHKDGILMYDVNFSTMQATVKKTGQTIKLNRNVKGETVLPPTWEDLQGQLWGVFPVNANSTEYKEVLQKFQSGETFINNVAKLERIQNVALYKQFLAQEEKVKNKMARAGVQNPVTRELFHGTSPDVCATIYKDGFDRSHAGRNATVYGKGVYFAVQARYSHRFALPGTNGHRNMFLAKVITGEYCEGNHSMITAPTKPGGLKNELYDSVVNQMNNPTMFVVFKDASVYPDYVLTYS